MTTDELKKLMIEIIQEEFTPNVVEIHSRWADGTLTMKPSNDTQPKDVPLEIFFRKIVGIRDALRVLEQKINTSPNIPLEDKISFQSYITKCYGTLTTFNILFKNDKDRFVGAGSKAMDDAVSDSKMSVLQAKKKLGLNEYGNE